MLIPTALPLPPGAATDALAVSHGSLDAPLRLPVTNLYKASGSSSVSMSGKIAQGCVQVGEVLKVCPAGTTCVVKGQPSLLAPVYCCAAKLVVHVVPSPVHRGRRVCEACLH